MLRHAGEADAARAGTSMRFWLEAERAGSCGRARPRGRRRTHVPRGALPAVRGRGGDNGIPSISSGELSFVAISFRSYNIEDTTVSRLHPSRLFLAEVNADIRQRARPPITATTLTSATVPPSRSYYESAPCGSVLVRRRHCRLRAGASLPIAYRHPGRAANRRRVDDPHGRVLLVAGLRSSLAGCSRLPAWRSAAAPPRHWLVRGVSHAVFSARLIVRVGTCRTIEHQQKGDRSSLLQSWLRPSRRATQAPRCS